MLGRGKEVRELLQGQGCAYRSYSQSSLKQSATKADSKSMFALAFLAALGVGIAFGAEDRPGFSERTRLQ
jgi:hypothetical protein